MDAKKEIAARNWLQLWMWACDEALCLMKNPAVMCLVIGDVIIVMTEDDLGFGAPTLQVFDESAMKTHTVIDRNPHNGGDDLSGLSHAVDPLYKYLAVLYREHYEHCLVFSEGAA